VSTSKLTPEKMYDEFTKGIWKENPVFVQVLGMCPTLAVTNSAVNAVTMGTATAFVLVGSCFLVSVLRKYIPKQVRITTYIVIIATFVTIADMVLEALVPAVHKELGAFIALIVVNCIILGRQEAFAGRNPPLPAVLDAAGMSVGFFIALMCLGTTREVLGSGSIFGVSLFGPNYEPWVIMILPPGGFLMLGGILLFFNWVRQRRLARAAGASAQGASA
jgi:electron transport complex protein RnfE